VSGACAIPADAGAVRSVLWAVDCNTRDFAHRGYEALAGGAAFQAALTVALTVYIALVGYRLLFAPDGARLSDGPRLALKIGAILALATSWNLFQTLVFDVAAKAPAEIAAVVSVRSVGGEQAMADPVGRLQVAYDQLFAAAAGFDKAGETAGKVQPPTTTPAAPEPDADAQTAEQGARATVAAHALTTAAGLILTVHAGLVAASTLAVGVLCAVGPIFIALFLFRQTRGFFVGWVRALAASALVSAGTWVLILLMLRVLDPWLVTLAQQRELKELDPRAGMSAATIVEVFTAAQIAMVLCAGAVAFAFNPSVGGRVAATAAPGSSGPHERGRTPAELTSRAGLLADQLRRFDQIFETRGRVAEARAAASSQPFSGRVGRGGARAGGDGGYRRPAVSGPRSRLGGRP
jgi:type IV secretion system protein VirB6